ncbi:hypothetical protein BXZ70DRAFT_997460 [Cristinia sonorae]|uniref:Uncharacterized protein n=1 Tax=Cristinia sonorae TaxID=1940300 RepID=A0A8K0XUY8_9AGAR|nr:hypothetical protein BXZ70DRAFT_997460 [Cristinia sonorae]
MPPKTAAKLPVKPAGKPSASRDLVPVGPREVTAKYHGKRNEDGVRPSTARALVLRNGRHGARGTGEIIMLNKMSGREKLDLLAEDLMERSKRALATPFRMEQCLKIAESQFMANLDECEAFQDPEIFYDKMKMEINARKTPASKADPFKNATYVAGIIGSKIHNTYMFASAWRLIAETLEDLQQEGLEDQTVRTQLQKSASMRVKYLVLYDVVNTLAGAYQSRLAQLAMTNPHYAQYFQSTTDPDTQEAYIGFDWAALKVLHKSFLDSIIIELCLPDPKFPRHILYMLLQEALEESPRDAKRFQQTLWDAVGDLSDTVKLLEMIETVLLGPEGDEWKKETGEKPAHYNEWLDAQWLSGKASEIVANFKDIIYPLEKTKTPNVLKNMWKFINLNYEQATGKYIDELWRIDDLHERIPQWHAFNINVTKDELGYDSDGPPSMVPLKKKGGKKPMAITNGEAGNDSDGSMPSLQTVSDTSDAESDFDDSEYDTDDEVDDSEEEYDEEDEDQLRDMLREAMDTAHAAEFFGHNADPAEFENMAADRKGNPFIKLLGSLRGRMFSSNPAVKTPGAKAREPYAPRPRPAAKPAAPKTTDILAVILFITVSALGDSQSRKATVEDVEDEDEITTAAKKKKKKKPKKKKKKPTDASGQADDETPQIATSSVPAPAAPAPQSPAPAPPKKKAAPKPKPAAASTASLNTFGSTTSLPLPQQSTAQSARSYLQSAGLGFGKQKVKTRGDAADLNTIPEKKKSIFSRFKRSKGDKAGDKDDDEDEDDEPTGDKGSFFSHLSKKTSNYMHQLIGGTETKKGGIAPLKWENFVKVMKEMGFEYDPSTAGSSVRFDPPSKSDPPITFHKPHPDPTLYPNHIRAFGKRLKKHYGWTEQDLFNYNKNMNV